MRIEEVMAELGRRHAIIVHCSRPGRSGEMGSPPPLYPDDLRSTIWDLAQGGVRPVSCSVVWPAHQDTFGSVGVIVAPRTITDIKTMHPTDAGFSEAGGGFGDPPSPAAVADTFANSVGHNEWVITGGEVTGIFVDMDGSLEVAKRMPPPDDLPEELREDIGEVVVAHPILLAEVQEDFPDLPIYGYVNGALTLVAPARNQP